MSNALTKFAIICAIIGAIHNFSCGNTVAGVWAIVATVWMINYLCKGPTIVEINICRGGGGNEAEKRTGEKE